jgi:hypothetical protein
MKYVNIDFDNFETTFKYPGINGGVKYDLIIPSGEFNTHVTAEDLNLIANTFNPIIDAISSIEIPNNIFELMGVNILSSNIMSVTTELVNVTSAYLFNTIKYDYIEPINKEIKIITSDIIDLSEDIYTVSTTLDSRVTGALSWWVYSKAKPSYEWSEIIGLSPYINKLNTIEISAEVNIIESITLDNEQLSVDKNRNVTINQRFTEDYEEKLLGIESGAQVNKIESITISGSTSGVTITDKNVNLEIDLSHPNKIASAVELGHVRLNPEHFTTDPTRKWNIIII